VLVDICPSGYKVFLIIAERDRPDLAIVSDWREPARVVEILKKLIEGIESATSETMGEPVSVKTGAGGNGTPPTQH
jgi:hypothetical protein